MLEHEPTIGGQGQGTGRKALMRLILRVNLAGPRGGQIFGKHDSGCVRYEFICTGGLSKAGCPPQCGRASPNQAKAWLEQKANTLNKGILPA